MVLPESVTDGFGYPSDKGSYARKGTSPLTGMDIP